MDLTFYGGNTEQKIKTDLLFQKQRQKLYFLRTVGFITIQ